ncbi:MAG TPA: Uma2 family endonuclease, partial [Isosphaeraceae bacterium]|jgi:Uma2 family endonuclease
VGETGWHVRSTFALYGVLRDHLAQDDAYVAAHLPLYYERGNPRARRAPDCMVIRGVGDHERRSFKTWFEGAVPEIVFELASDETFREDLGAKRLLYQGLGVCEYFLFDPLGDCLDPRLQGFRLDGREYGELAPDVDGSLISHVLGLRLIAEGTLLRAIDLRTNRPLPTFEEKAAELAREAGRIERERQRVAALAAEVERLRGLLGRQGRSATASPPGTRG